MRIGYACLTAGKMNFDLRTCTAKRASENVLREIIGHNLRVLGEILRYNKREGIRLFRISSDIIPFASSPVNTLCWWDIWRDELRALGRQALDDGVRLSMHPGQYTVLNSPDGGVVARAVEDLVYHARFLDALGLPPEHKLILHIGGAYGDKKAAIARFCENYRKLPDGVKARLVIENDDRIYTVREVLEIGKREEIPVVLDTLHHEINPGTGEDVYTLIEACRETWGEVDGAQKIHLSQQGEGARPGSHSQTIALPPFCAFVQGLKRDDIDIMLEVKDKNLSAVKCIRALDKRRKIGLLEEEWGRYKYAVLERNPAAYRQIRALLKDKSAYPAMDFYNLIDTALTTEIKPGNAVNAAQHVWGYFKKEADAKAAADFQKKLNRYAAGGTTLKPVKKHLWQLAEKYHSSYLLDGYYFAL